MKCTTTIKKMTIPGNLKAELDALVESSASDRRWNKESEAVLFHYYTHTDATINTLCMVLKKAFPDKTWPYAIVNGKLQYLKKLGCFEDAKAVK